MSRITLSDSVTYPVTAEDQSSTQSLVSDQSAPPGLEDGSTQVLSSLASATIEFTDE